MSSEQPRLAIGRPRRWRLVSALVTLVGLVALLGWYSLHPTPLPRSDDSASATTPVDVPVYVGVADGVEGRTLDLAGVKTLTTSNTEVEVTPLLCRDGRVDVTSDPAPFCAELIDPEGQTFTSSDSIVLEIVSEAPALAVVEQVRLAFREGVQWDTVPTGRGAIIRVLAR